MLEGSELGRWVKRLKEVSRYKLPVMKGVSHGDVNIEHGDYSQYYCKAYFKFAEGVNFNSPHHKTDTEIINK